MLGKLPKIGKYAKLLGILAAGGAGVMAGKKFGMTNRDIITTALPFVGDIGGGILGGMLGTAIPIPGAGTILGTIGGGMLGGWAFEQLSPYIADALGFTEENDAKERQKMLEQESDPAASSAPSVSMPENKNKTTPKVNTQAPSGTIPSPVPDVQVSPNTADVGDVESGTGNVAEIVTQASAAIVSALASPLYSPRLYERAAAISRRCFSLVGGIVCSYFVRLYMLV